MIPYDPSQDHVFDGLGAECDDAGSCWLPAPDYLHDGEAFRIPLPAEDSGWQLVFPGRVEGAVALDGGSASFTTGCLSLEGEESWPFTFYVREGRGEDIQINLQSGSYCTSLAGCETWAYARDRPGGRSMYELRQAEPPVAMDTAPADLDTSILWVPYCTGDMHTGARDDGGVAGGIAFRGSDNLRFLAAWVRDQLLPEHDGEVVIIGRSTGGYGAWMATPTFAQVLGADRALTSLDLSDPGLRPNAVVRAQAEAFGLDHLWSTWGMPVPRCRLAATDPSGMQCAAAHWATVFAAAPQAGFAFAGNALDDVLADEAGLGPCAFYQASLQLVRGLEGSGNYAGTLLTDLARHGARDWLLEDARRVLGEWTLGDRPLRRFTQTFEETPAVTWDLLPPGRSCVEDELGVGAIRYP